VRHWLAKAVVSQLIMLAERIFMVMITFILNYTQFGTKDKICRSIDSDPEHRSVEGNENVLIALTTPLCHEGF
jgi:hypothetical protein